MAKLIAEIGINHLGDTSKLLNMIRTLASNNIDSCKLQFRSDSNFFDHSLEMGSTLISQELDDVNVDLATTLEAISFAKSLGIEVGVSFFRVSDAEILTNSILPDFFKVPSAEALNFDLIRYLQEFDRPVYVSTGGLNYAQLQSLADKIEFRAFDCVMYCVANYPVALGVSKPSYIESYRELFDCLIGYSSHDANWEMNIAFLDRKVDLIERHYAESKEDLGLDISTSSDISELKKLQSFCSNSVWHEDGSILNKVANQGELQNLKDLGSGYYFDRSYQKGEVVDVRSLIVKSPCRGIKAGSIKESVKIVRSANVGEALSASHIKAAPIITAKTVSKGNSAELSLPVRLHDFVEINKIFDINNYEWHLSFKEVEIAKEKILTDFRELIRKKKFSIHLPDYVSSKYLIDPFSYNPEVRERSDQIINQVIDLARSLQTITGEEVPIVGSFSVQNDSKKAFYQQLAEKVHSIHASHSVKIMPQFLPKLAWYFGGSVELNVFCDLRDLSFFKYFETGICLDVAHCIMASNFFQKDHVSWMESLLPLTGHLHLSDAEGQDGEGVPFGAGEVGSALPMLMSFEGRKVIEQWEGHLDNFRGFKDAFNFLTEGIL
jgi:sialic acid synthase SpsE/sugar phosphate isomerase/epimerase